MFTTFILVSSLFLAAAPQGTVPPERAVQERIVLDDFDQYRPGGLPTFWKRLKDKELVPVDESYMLDNEYFVVRQEGNRKFVRVFTQSAATRIIKPNGDGYEWNLRDHPRLAWDWRALQLPSGAREDKDKFNDTGAAVYVTFSISLLSPKSIKYTYSSTLPVGTIISYRGLKVLVVASGKNAFGEWMRVERDVAADYRRLWGGEPPERPLSIMLWSDSNTLKGVSEADFDRITLLAAR